MSHLTALENVLVGQHHLSRPILGLVDPVLLGARNRWKHEALGALRAAGLESLAGIAVRNLPYGIRKQIELARAMLAQPKLLLLDEPAAGLNPTEARALKDQLETIAASGVTLLVIEHNMQFVGDLCHRVVVLNFGRKIADGPTEKVRNMAEVREAYLGTDAPADA
jgi:ABC-type branched-subunit amino acid transport system ATPase component